MADEKKLQNSFVGANVRFPNMGIHFMLAEIMKLRKQATFRLTSEFRGQSGWSNAMNDYLVTELEKLAQTLKRITYNPEPTTKDELEKQASDTTRKLSSAFNAYSLHDDNVLGPVEIDTELVWDLTGSHPDIPQVNPENCPNDVARTFIRYLDRFFVQLTRLDSRHQSNMITKYESVMMEAYLGTLYTICQVKGGEVNRSDIPSGTLKSDEASTFQG